MEFIERINMLLSETAVCFPRHTSLLQKMDEAQIFYQDHREQLLSYINEVLNSDIGLGLPAVLKILDDLVNSHFQMDKKFRISEAELYPERMQ